MSKPIAKHALICYTTALDFDKNLKDLRQLITSNDLSSFGISAQKVINRLKIIEERVEDDRKIFATLYKILKEERNFDERNSNGELSSNEKVQS